MRMLSPHEHWPFVIQRMQSPLSELFLALYIPSPFAFPLFVLVSTSCIEAKIFDFLLEMSLWTTNFLSAIIILFCRQVSSLDRRRATNVSPLPTFQLTFRTDPTILRPTLCRKCDKSPKSKMASLSPLILKKSLTIEAVSRPASDIFSDCALPSAMATCFLKFPVIIFLNPLILLNFLECLNESASTHRPDQRTLATVEIFAPNTCQVPSIRLTALPSRRNTPVLF